jgi:FkbM family methyltransferase
MTNSGHMPSPMTMEGMLQKLSCRVAPASIVDIGAARGEWTRLAKRVFPHSRVLMIEPLTENASALQRTASECDHVEFTIVAVGDKEQEITFHVTDDLDGSGVYADPGPSSRRIWQTTLDVLVSKHGLHGPLLIKFDTHGYEMPILTGAKRVLESVQCVVMECYNYPVSPTAIPFWEMCARMSDLGFRVADFADPLFRPRDGALWQFDLSFLREDHPLFSYTDYP